MAEWWKTWTRDCTKMDADSSAKNILNAPEFICPICLSKPKSFGFQWKKASLGVHSPLGLNRTGHMSFLTGQDRTPNLLDRTESGLIFLTFYLTSMGYQLSYDKVPGHKFGVKKSQLGCIWKWKKKALNFFFLFFLLFLKELKVRRPGRKMSGFWTIRILKICRTSRPDMM